MKYITIIKAISIGLVMTMSVIGQAQQKADNGYNPIITKPLYEKGEGPVVLVDGGHNNFHVLEDKFAGFGKVAEMDGFKTKSLSGPIDNKVLKETGILVIANALNEKNVDSWKLPVYPAFTKNEIRLISDWVKNGGSLFLIADHMPFPAAVSDLADQFGFTLYNGFAMRRPKEKFDVFSYGNGMLKGSELTKPVSQLDSIVTFTGHAFKIHDSATSVITLDSAYKILMPEVAWEFNSDMKIVPAEGLSQLAYCRYGKGKIVVSGEAMMFTAQKVGDVKVGLNAPFASHNLQLLLNILEWLN
jgi:hypothetical protein